MEELAQRIKVQEKIKLNSDTPNEDSKSNKSAEFISKES